jgi:hypothetical protein
MQTIEPPLDTFVQINVSPETSQESEEANGKTAHSELFPDKSPNDVSNSSVSHRRSFWHCDESSQQYRDEPTSCCCSHVQNDKSDQKIKDYFHGRNVLALGGRLVCGPPEEYVAFSGLRAIKYLILFDFVQVQNSDSVSCTNNDSFRIILCISRCKARSGDLSSSARFCCVHVRMDFVVFLHGGNHRFAPYLAR